MMRPAPRVAALRRVFLIHLPAMAAGAAMFVPNASAMNGGTIFGGALLVVFGSAAITESLNDV